MKPLKQSLLLIKKLATPAGDFRKAQRTLALALSLSLLAVMPLPRANALGIPNPIANFPVLEDSPDTVFNLDDVFSDATSYSVLFNGNSTLVDASISGSDLILNYAENQFGSALIRVSATDGVNTVANSFTVTVIPVNDAPSTTPAVFPDQITFEGTPVTISFTVHDVEDDAFPTPLTVSADANVNPVIGGSGLPVTRSDINNRACTLTMTPVPGAVGQATISVIVSDNGVPPLSAIRSFKLTVIPSTSPNNPPVAVINVSLDADLDGGDPEVIVISVNGVDAPVTLDGTMSSDPDGDPLMHSWNSGAIVGEPIVSTRFALGTHPVSLEVSDGRGGLDAAVVSVKVITVAEAIGYLKDEVNGSGLSRYWKNWLRSSLNVAENLFASTPRPGRPSPCQLGKGGLEFFRWLVGGLATPGPGSRPAVISSELATELIRLTDEILNNVSCP